MVPGSTINEPIINCKTSSQSQGEYISNEFLSSLKEEVINPLQSFLNEFKSAGQKLSNDYQNSENFYNQNLEKLEKLKTSYHLQCKSYEDKKESMISTEEDEIEKKKCESLYIHQINFCNLLRDKFFDNSKFIYSEFQNLDQRCIDIIKDSIRKFNVYQVSLLRNLQYDFEKIGKILDMVNPLDDIQLLEKINMKNINKKPKSEFIEYKRELKLNQTSSMPSLIDFTKSIFSYQNPEKMVFDQISQTISSMLDGKLFQNEEKMQFLNLLKNEKNKKFFFDTLSNFKLKSNFILNDNSFAVVGEILLLLLDDILVSNDYSSFKQILDLSQTLYKNSKVNNKPRIFIQNAIQIHPIWSDLNFWEEVIKYSIDLQIQKVTKISGQILVDSFQKKIQGIAFEQMTCFTFNLMAFDLKKSLVKEILTKISNSYQLTNDQIQNLCSIIDDYNLSPLDKSVSLIDYKNELKISQEKETQEIEQMKKIIELSLSSLQDEKKKKSEKE